MKLYKYRSLANRGYVEDILANSRLYCSPYYELNDPFEGQFLQVLRFSDGEQNGGIFQTPVMASVDDIIGYEDYFDVRVCSMSSSSKDIRLWSLYGGGHAGIALEIETNGLAEQPKQVTYSPGLYLFDTPGYAGPSIEGALTKKTNHWAYEREHRFISTNNYVDVTGHIQRVIFGARCRSDDKTWIKELLPEGVCLAQAHLDSNSANIDINIY